MNKKDNELWILEQFKSFYKDFPKGKIESSESPDFLIAGTDKIVGVEIAEVFQDLHVNKSSKLKERESIQGRFGESLLKALILILPKKKFFMLDANFNDSRPIKVHQIDNLVSECVPDCAEFLLNNSKGDVRIENNGLNLPKEINSIWIQIGSYSAEPIYCNGQGGTISTLKNKHIEPILKKHDKSLSYYNTCDEYWLIIREGNYHAGSFSDEIAINLPVKTNFDKVFLFRTRASSKNKIFILK